MNYKKNILPIVISAILAGGITACGTDKTIEESLISANQYVKAGDNNSAVIELKNALKKDSSNALARELLGNIYLDAGDATKAEKELNRAYEMGSMTAAISLLRTYQIQKENEKILNLSSKLNFKKGEDQAVVEIYRALAFYRLGQDEKAGESIGYANELATDSIYSRLGKAYLATKQKNNNEAIRIVDILVNENPTFLDAILLQGQLQFAYKDYNKAILSFNKYQELQPKDLSIKLMLANAYVKNEQYQEAEIYLDQLLLIAPEHAFINQLKGLVRYSSQDYEKAQYYISKAIQNGMMSPENRLLAGFSAFNLNNYEQSYSYLVGLSEDLEPTHPAMRMLAIAQVKLGYPIEASQVILRKEELSAQDLDVLSAVSIELSDTDNLEQMIKIKRKVDDVEPTDALGFFHKGKLQLSLNDVQGVINLEKSLELNDNFSEAKVLLATEYLRTKQYNKVLDLTKLWIEKDGDNFEVYNIVAMANLGLNQELAAINAMNKALELKPTNPLSLMFLAEQDIKNNAYNAAKTKLELLLQDKPNYIPGLSSYYFLMNKLDMTSVAIQKIKDSQQNNLTSIPHAMLLSKVYVSQGMSKEAINVLQNFPKTANLPPIYWINLGNSLLLEGELKQVEKLYDEWTKLQPTQKLSWIRVAVTAEHSKDYEKGLLAITEGLKFIPNDTQLLILQTYFYYQLNKLDMAQANINDFPHSVKTIPAVEGLQGKVWAKNGKYTKALDKLLIGYKASPSSKNTMYIYNVYKSLNEEDKAEGFALTHLENQSNDLFIRAMLAQDYSVGGKSDNAYTQYKKIIDISPNNILALNNLAWFEYQKKNLVLADSYGERALKLAPNNVNVLDTLASIKIAIGNKEKGIEMLKKAQQIAPNNIVIEQHLKEAQN